MVKNHFPNSVFPEDVSQKIRFPCLVSQRISQMPYKWFRSQSLQWSNSQRVKLFSLDKISRFPENKVFHLPEHRMSRFPDNRNIPSPLKYFEMSHFPKSHSPFFLLPFQCLNLSFCGIKSRSLLSLHFQLMNYNFFSKHQILFKRPKNNLKSFNWGMNW